MTDNVKVAISSDFLTAFARLPRQVQGKVTEFVNKFRNNPMSPGINYEKLNSGIDKKIFSVRIDDTYRGIVAFPFFFFLSHYKQERKVNRYKI